MVAGTFDRTNLAIYSRINETGHQLFADEQMIDPQPCIARPALPHDRRLDIAALSVGRIGAHGARAVHSKGFILLGSFAPNPEALALSRARLLEGPEPVIVRFSNFIGIPDIRDTDPNGQPRGFAVKFLMDDGSNFDLVNHSYNGFPSPTAADFGDLLQAIGASGLVVAKPTPLDRYLDGHPAAKHFLTTQTPPPESWATTAYFGVNAYQMANADGRSEFVRFRFVPPSRRALSRQERSGG